MTRPRWRTHLESRERVNGHAISICGQYKRGIVLSPRLHDVDCLHCLNAARPEKMGWSGAARWRAIRRLCEAHADQLAVLYADELAAEQAHRTRQAGRRF